MKKDNESLTKEMIELILSSYVEGKITRIELALWGQEKNKLFQLNGYSNSIDSISLQSFFAIRSAIIKDKNFNEEGLPYFIRDYDLNEWLLSLRSRDFEINNHSKVQQLRPHQIFNIGTTQFAAVNIDPDIISFKLGVEHIRGVDGLDFFQEYNFQISNTTIFRLIRHMRSPEPNAFIFYSNKNEPSEEIFQLLKWISVCKSDLIWMNPKLKFDVDKLV